MPWANLILKSGFQKCVSLSTPNEDACCPVQYFLLCFLIFQEFRFFPSFSLHLFTLNVFLNLRTTSITITCKFIHVTAQCGHRTLMFFLHNLILSTWRRSCFNTCCFSKLCLHCSNNFPWTFHTFCSWFIIFSEI